MIGAAGSLVSGMLGFRGDSSRFIVTFDEGKYDLGLWARVSGLSVQYDSIEYRTGDSNQIWTMPGLPKYSKISLSRATGYESNIVQHWIAETSLKPRAYSGSIVLQTLAGLPLCTWTLKHFVPCGWKISDFETKAATIVMETLDLAHTGFLWDDIDLGVL